MQLGWISRHRPEISRLMKTEVDVFLETVPDYFLNFTQDMRGIEKDAFSVDSLREGKYLPYQVSAPLGASLQGGQHHAAFLVVHFLFEELDRHENWRKYVVQIVRNTPRQRADTLHPLGAQEL